MKANELNIGKRVEQTLHKVRCMNGRQAHEKKLFFICQQGNNGNENCNEILFTPMRTAEMTDGDQ